MKARLFFAPNSNTTHSFVPVWLFWTNWEKVDKRKRHGWNTVYWFNSQSFFQGDYYENNIKCGLKSRVNQEPQIWRGRFCYLQCWYNSSKSRNAADSRCESCLLSRHYHKFYAISDVYETYQDWLYKEKYRTLHLLKTMRQIGAENYTGSGRWPFVRTFKNQILRLSDFYCETRKNYVKDSRMRSPEYL